MFFSQQRGCRGFTLVELMVAVGILVLISSIAIPSYLDNVRKGDRAAARALLLEDAQFMEQFFTENSSYLQTAGAVPAQPVLPQLVSPKDATLTRIKYNISFRAVPARTASTFALQAVPANSMIGDSCLTLTYNNLGQKGVDGAPTNGMTSETCWTQ